MQIKILEDEKIAKAKEQEKFEEQMMTRIALLEKEVKTKESTLHLQSQEVKFNTMLFHNVNRYI